MKVGLIVNPIAGMGGKVALKGTDGVVEEAIKRGAKPVALELAKVFLRELSHYDEAKKLKFLTGVRELGEYAFNGLNIEFKVLKHGDFSYKIVEGIRIPETSAEDTKDLVRLMLGNGVELVTFAGGDGTARDIYSVVKNTVPILGIPTGVKMYSGVFASSPEDAAKTVVAFLDNKAEIKDEKILDIDEEGFRKDIIRIKNFGTAKTPHVKDLMPGAKEPTPVNENEDIEAIVEALIEELEDGVYFLGSGSTLKLLKDKLGIDGTLLGIDIIEIKKGKARLIVKDAQEKDLLRFVNHKPKIIITPIGGQGFLFGRGNQQFSADVLRHVSKEDIVVISTASKLSHSKVLRIYTGEEEVDRKFRGFIKVKISPWSEKMVKVV